MSEAQAITDAVNGLKSRGADYTLVNDLTTYVLGLNPAHYEDFSAVLSALAAALRRKGHAPLLVDTDPQCNSTDTYRAQTEGVATLYDVFCEGEPALAAIQHTQGGDILPADKLLSRAEALGRPSAEGLPVLAGPG